jgi:hypothetical protein
MLDSQPFLENREAATLAQAIVDTVHEPLLVLDKDLGVLAASRSFYLTFKVAKADTIGRPLYALGDGQWDTSPLVASITRNPASANVSTASRRTSPSSSTDKNCGNVRHNWQYPRTDCVPRRILLPIGDLSVANSAAQPAQQNGDLADDRRGIGRLYADRRFGMALPEMRGKIRAVKDDRDGALRKKRRDRRNLTIAETDVQDTDIGLRVFKQRFRFREATRRTDNHAARLIHGEGQRKRNERFVFRDKNFDQMKQWVSSSQRH